MTHHNNIHGTITVGDVRHFLPTLADDSIDCIVTSPPYVGLRDYGHAQQLGASSSVDQWLDEMVEVIEECKRILTPTGSLWLNVGDRYARHRNDGAPTKSLLLAPQRLAIQLVERGWRVRNWIIWAKTNPMPSAVADRLSNTHESVLLLTPNDRYYFNLNGIRVPATSKAAPSRSRPPRAYPPVSATFRRSDDNTGLDAMKQRGSTAHPLGKSPGDVWPIATASFRGAHFATFPQALVERMVTAGCPEKVCPACQRAWLPKPVYLNDRWLRIGPLQPECDCNQGSRRGVVLDPFMGSGTTALAAETLGRNWAGIELNPDYAHLATERIEAARQSRAARK
ncbi:Methyltransferase [Tsukamurella ocularis]|uniref:DNA-methyltransferase n=1 Tax=Tsukamurella ocularis TaxID=1970234 RepID=UPI0039F0E95B